MFKEMLQVGNKIPEMVRFAFHLLQYQKFFRGDMPGQVSFPHIAAIAGTQMVLLISSATWPHIAA